jgi:hypothetical protein
MQSIIITRMILSILLVPLAILVAAILAVFLGLWALSVHPLLALGFLVLCGVGIAIAARWEWRRVGRDVPPED